MASVFRRIRLRMQSVKSDLLLFPFPWLLTSLERVGFNSDYLLGFMSDPDMYDCFCLCLITRVIGCLSCFLALPIQISACLDALYWVRNIPRTPSRLTLICSLQPAKRKQPISFLIRAWRITEQTQPRVRREGTGSPMHRRSCLSSIPILLAVGHLRLLVSSCSIEKTESVDENYCLWCKRTQLPCTFGLWSGRLLFSLHDW